MSEEFKELRESFGLFATGVVLATTTNDGNSNFITINSLSSISLDPALLSFCIDNKSSNFDSFTKNQKFTINILTSDQTEISKIFAKAGQKDGVDNYFFKSDIGNLILKDSLAYFECERYNVIPAGDHTIIIGKIVNFSKLESEKSPLLYFKGGYNSL